MDWHRKFASQTMKRGDPEGRQWIEIERSHREQMSTSSALHIEPAPAPAPASSALHNEPTPAPALAPAPTSINTSTVSAIASVPEGMWRDKETDTDR